MNRIAGWASMTACLFVFLFAVRRAAMNPEGILAVTVFLLPLLFFFFRKKSRMHFICCWNRLSRKHLLLILFFTHAVSLSMMIWVAYYGEVDLSWDWGVIINSATNLAIQNTNWAPEYFLRYPNNQFWLAVLTGVLKIIYKLGRSFFFFSPELFKWISTALAILMMRIAFAFLFVFIKERWGEKTAIIADAGIVLFLPSIMYSGFAYTDVPAFMMLSVVLFLSGRCFRRKAVIWQILFGLAAAVLFRIKTIALVFILAVIGSYLLSDEKASEKIKTSVLLVVFFIIFATIIMLPVNSLIKVDQSDADEYEFPVWHWIAMALQQRGILSGAYSEEDMIYTMSFPDKASKSEADINLLKERLEGLGINGTAEVILWWKPLRAYGSPFLLADDYISRNAIRPHSLVERILGAKGDLHYLATFAAWIQYFTLLTGMVFGSISRRLKGADAGGICVFGLVLFFFIWEVSPRYLFLFIPVFEILAVDGWRAFLKRT